MWLPVSAPRPISSGDCAMRTKRREPSGEITSRTASARAEIWASGIGFLVVVIVARRLARKTKLDLTTPAYYKSCGIGANRTYSRESRNGFGDDGGELMRKGVFAVVCLVLSGWGAAVPTAAQETTGTISGTVLDAQGAAVPNATVTIKNTDTNVVIR